MTTEPAQPRPELWTRIVWVINQLHALLLATAPELFAGVSVQARAQLAAAAALVRRYIHVLAAELALPPAPPRPPAVQTANPSAPGSSSREAPWRLTEPLAPRRAARAGTGAKDTPMLQWALTLAALQRLSAVMADPAAHARRLAVFLRRESRETLRPAPARWAVIRQLPVFTDALLSRLDQAARPAAWAGLNTS